MDLNDICIQMEEGNSNWSSERNRVQAGNYIPSSNGQSLYTRFTQNLNRSHGPLTLGRAQEEGSRLIRDNISSVINELGPLVDPIRQRETGGLNLRSWVRRQQQLDRSVPQIAVPTSSESTIIDFGNSHEFNTPLPQTNVFQPVRNGTVPQQLPTNTSVNLVECTNNDSPGNEQHVTNSNDNQNPSTSNNVPDSVAVTADPNAENEETDEENQDIEFVVNFLHKCFPFMLILLGKAIYDHRTGILIFVGLLITFIHADFVVKREVSKQNERSLIALFILFVNLFCCISFVYYVFEDQQLYKSLIFIPPYSQPLSLCDLLWIVGITDFVLKLITIQIKAFLTCLPDRLLPYSGRGKWYLFLECVSQLYRGLVPIHPWMYYLLDSYQGPDKVVGVFLSAAYMVSKGSDLVGKVRLFKAALWRLLRNNFGVSPSKEQLDTAGTHCPICHDHYETPILLNCRHVFCKACVTTWFDREPTCPLCRTKIADDAEWKDGGSPSVHKDRQHVLVGGSLLKCEWHSRFKNNRVPTKCSPSQSDPATDLQSYFI